MTRVDYDAARAQIGVAGSQLAAADAELEAAQIALRDCVLRAPMDALVLSRAVEVGTLAAQGAGVFVLADIARMKVFVVEEEKGRPVVRARDVELGAIAGNVIHVAAGLNPKDRVVVTGASLVADGEPIRIVE